MDILALGLALTGSALLVIAIANFLLQVRIFGIPVLVLEAMGIACLSLSFGIQDLVVMLYILLGGVILAIFFDPFVWKWKDIGAPNDKTFSVIGNGMMGAIMIIFYALGTRLS